MKYSRTILFLCIAGLNLTAEAAPASDATADESAFLGQIRTPAEQTMGHGQSALWTMPEVATQYQPLHPTHAMQAAMQAQREGRFLDALIQLDEAEKSGQAGEDATAEMSLLRASFLLQGNQPQQAAGILTPLLANSRHAADAYALTAMAHLQQRQTQKALEAARHAHDFQDGMLPHLALSYALQGAGRLAEARDEIHRFNAQTPQRAIALAREAELALTLGDVQSARTLVAQAQGVEAHPYVIAVSGLTWLIDGQADKAKAAFETALRRDPKDAKALLGLGLAEIKLGNIQEGLKKLQAANEAEPGNALILTYLGRAQQQAGDTEAARTSWRSAQQADPKDPTSWLYQAQAELQVNRLADARESLREAQARSAYRAVYRGAALLREDEQLLQANLAEIQRRLGLEGIAFHTLVDPVGAHSATSLRNQADLLQGQRFGESARRSLLLQSQFDELPGNLPAALDIYGDGAGQTGASNPQHGAVSGLAAQQASFNNYDALFSQRTMLEADVIAGSKDSRGEQIRLGVGNDTLGLSIAQRQYKTDGFAPFENLDNHIWQGTVQWRPAQSTQLFVSHQNFHSKHGETFLPADSILAAHALIEDESRVTRLGLRQSLTDDSELRVLWSRQQTDQPLDYQFIFLPFRILQTGSSGAHGAELQYRRSGADYATQWGVQQNRVQTNFRNAAGIITQDYAQNARQLYAAWQQTLNPYWQLDAGLGWGRLDNSQNKTSLQRWLPKLGMVFTPDAATHVRVAAWHGLSVFALGDATLAPATVAGIVMNRHGDNGKLVRAVSLDADRQLSPAWLLAGQTQRRKSFEPFNITGEQDLLPNQIEESRLALHWQPQQYRWAVSLAYDYERKANDHRYSWLDSVLDQRLRARQVSVRWFGSAQWTANVAWSQNRVDGRSASILIPLIPYQDRFNQVDADLSWQFNGPRGVLSAGVRNATDKRFTYAETDPLNPRFSNGRMAYAKLKLAW